MTKLIPKSKILEKINSLKRGGNIPKYLNAGVLKKIYYSRSPDYSKTEDGKQQSFSDAKDYKLIRYDYLKAIENPNNVGYDSNTDKWTTPKQSGFDPDLIGIGLDTRNNNIVKNYLKKTGRTKNPWLTLKEMELLLDQSLLYLEDVFEKNTKGMKPSDTKRAIVIGLLYHGHGPNFWNNKRNLYNVFIHGTDLDFINAVTDFYGNNTRADRHSLYWNSNKK